MSTEDRHYATPVMQHPSEALPDEVIPNDAPPVASSRDIERETADARTRGALVDRLPYDSRAPIEQSPAESVHDATIPNDFPGSSTEGGNVSNGLSTWPSSSAQTSSADVSASSSAGLGTERPGLAPLTTGLGSDPSRGELMRSPNSATGTEMPPPPYTRGQSPQAQTAIAPEPPSASSNDHPPPSHNYPGLPPGVSPGSAEGSLGSGSQEGLLRGGLQDANTRAVTGQPPGEAVSLPKYSNRPQNGDTRLQEGPDGALAMFPMATGNGQETMRDLGTSDTTSDPEAQPVRAGAVEPAQETETRNPLRKFWRRHFRGPQNRNRRKVLIMVLIFILVLLIILLAVLGAKGRLTRGGDDSDSDSEDDDDDDDE